MSRLSITPKFWPLETKDGGMSETQRVERQMTAIRKRNEEEK